MIDAEVHTVTIVAESRAITAVGVGIGEFSFQAMTSV